MNRTRTERSPNDAPPSGNAIAPIRVALVCAIRPGVGGPEILIARRPVGSPLAGLWEFPGGKVEQGESVEAAARREALEEVGLEVAELKPLIRVRHTYPHAEIELHAFLGPATIRRGIPAGEAGAPACRWVPVGELRDYAWPAANAPILDALDTWEAAAGRHWTRSAS
ncbi:MAG: (deoxy)nucleoside triphosphate pyrophosphohydrolase [Phycisphaerales bacterium]|nr:(deoxy)nucleoside triphosphate pyrophosphohydrolase [Phycisphaerales bacterium]